MPSRYVQWSCSTPTMIFTISRISSLSPLDVATTMLADWAMVVTGYAASELPPLLAGACVCGEGGRGRVSDHAWVRLGSPE
jgi:hypothetical protein